MKLLPLLIFSAESARFDRKKEKPDITLKPELEAHWGNCKTILTGMQGLFAGLEPVGRKDYADNAKGMMKWLAKLKKAYNKRETCVDGFFPEEKFV